MRKVLASCRIKGFTSLAVPILGTGAVLKFPHGLASRVLLEEVHQFDEDQASGSSFLVRFVIHPSNRELKKVPKKKKTFYKERAPCCRFS